MLHLLGGLWPSEAKVMRSMEDVVCDKYRDALRSVQVASEVGHKASLNHFHTSLESWPDFSNARSSFLDGSIRQLHQDLALLTYIHYCRYLEYRKGKVH